MLYLVLLPLSVQLFIPGIIQPSSLTVPSPSNCPKLDSALYSNSSLLSHLYSSGNNHNTNNYTALNTKYLLINHQLTVFGVGCGRHPHQCNRECECELHGNEYTVQLSSLQILPILSNSHSTEILTPRRSLR